MNEKDDEFGVLARSRNATALANRRVLPMFNVVIKQFRAMECVQPARRRVKRDIF